MKRWHMVVAILATLLIGAYIAMIVGPHVTRHVTNRVAVRFAGKE
jgi:hypothetical protein